MHKTLYKNNVRYLQLYHTLRFKSFFTVVIHIFQFAFIFSNYLLNAFYAPAVVFSVFLRLRDSFFVKHGDILAGIDEKSLLNAVSTAVDMVKAGDNGIPVPTYTDENVSTKVVKIIQSYTGVVDKMVWRKF